PLSSYLRRMVGSAADADDLLQEAWIRIAGGLSHFEKRSNIKTWAFKIATNIAIDFLRKSKKALMVEFDEVEEYPDIDEEDRLVLDEMNQCIRDVINSLPPDYRAALVLYNLEGKSIADISKICDISIATAKIRIHRAKERLRQALEKECDFYKSEEGNLRCDRKDPGDVS
ncbi:MAG: RNA polymerase sigma factor, partial [Planctomycetota bacterium]